MLPASLPQSVHSHQPTPPSHRSHSYAVASSDAHMKLSLEFPKIDSPMSRTQSRHMQPIIGCVGGGGALVRRHVTPSQESPTTRSRTKGQHPRRPTRCPGLTIRSKHCVVSGFDLSRDEEQGESFGGYLRTTYAKQRGAVSGCPIVDSDMTHVRRTRSGSVRFSWMPSILPRPHSRVSSPPRLKIYSV